MPFVNKRRFGTRLKAIPVEIRKNLRAQLKANAEELVAAQRQYAPVDDQAGGELRDSIRQKDNSTAARMSRVVRAGGATTTRAVRKGVKATYDYALGQEFGTENMPANPFFFPPYRAKRKAFKARLAKAAKAGARAAVARS